MREAGAVRVPAWMSSRTLVAAAVAGHGIILQPRAVVADALATGALVPILTNYTAPSGRYTCCTRRVGRNRRA